MGGGMGGGTTVLCCLVSNFEAICIRLLDLEILEVLLLIKIKEVAYI